MLSLTPTLCDDCGEGGLRDDGLRQRVEEHQQRLRDRVHSVHYADTHRNTRHFSGWAFEKRGTKEKLKNTKSAIDG